MMRALLESNPLDAAVDDGEGEADPADGLNTAPGARVSTSSSHDALMPVTTMTLLLLIQFEENAPVAELYAAMHRSPEDF